MSDVLEDGAAASVQITCNGRRDDDSHVPEPIELFVLVRLGGKLLGWSAQSKHGTGTLIGDDYLTPARWSAVMADWERGKRPVTRVRYRFACPVCRYARELERARLTPILDELATRGIGTVTLRGLAAIL